MKRIFDVLFSLIVILCFFPLGLIISILIKLSSSGGIFYSQIRIGKNAKPFKIYKFRSMKIDSDHSQKLTIGMKDPRITSIGFFIRKYKLDEFPQFINVLIGNMSIVGPRPEVKEYVDLYNEEQRKVLSVKPGITDYASLEYFDENELLGKADDPQETYINEIMPAKLELNKKYLANPTISHDISIMWKTFMKMIK
jgi:lipopolysaccharide/colanic/teichoic acid biosynthesis glycosyltransferase